MLHRALKLKQASAVLRVEPKELQNLVQFGVVRPQRVDGTYLFDRETLLTAKVAFRLKESLGDARKRSFEAYRRLSRLREGTPHQEPGVRGLYVPLLCRGGAH